MPFTRCIILETMPKWQITRRASDRILVTCFFVAFLIRERKKSLGAQSVCYDYAKRIIVVFSHFIFLILYKSYMTERFYLRFEISILFTCTYILCTILYSNSFQLQFVIE